MWHAAGVLADALLAKALVEEGVLERRASEQRRDAEAEFQHKQQEAELLPAQAKGPSRFLRADAGTVCGLPARHLDD